jgi:phosphate:Na+ symporter
MTPLNALVFGLGLFFIGLHLVGDNLKALSGGRFRDGIARTTRRPLPRLALGLASGALMQSATAVTFICVSLVVADLLTANAAGLVIVWSNVGLTVLAFVATLDIHPAVAFLVGGAGIVMGVVRNRSWQTVASVLIGIGLILFGLEQMSAGAAPLKDEPWFRDAIGLAVSSPALAFLSGILVASILQSNSGATMMIITLANAGALDLPDAALMIYGTNLGAITLRLMLATGLRGQALRLVRMEDFFCLLGGGLMFGLYYLERSGIPLVLALSGEISAATDKRLAILFLLSNLIPALVISPFIPLVTRLLKQIWPSEAPDVPGAPKFLNTQALDDAATALALIRKELARLLRMVTGEPGAPRDASEDSGPSANFEKLSNAIETFASQLASRAPMSEGDAFKLHALRSALSGIRHLEEAARLFVARAQIPGVIAPDQRQGLDSSLLELLGAMAKAMDEDDIAVITAIRDRTKIHGDFMAEIRQQLGPPSGGSLDQSALFVDFEFVAWALHHLTKILVRLEAPRQPPAPG